jgi:lysozyme family protein
MINVNKTMADMAVMSDQQLKQTAVMNKTDPYMIALLSGESARRQAIRRGAQAGAQKLPTVIDQTLAQMDAGQAQAMPEDLGIATLNTPNMETMAAAEGGIVGYADGGMVAFAKGGKPNTDVFERAFQTVLRLEGGAKFVADDAGKGPTKYGINQTANPDLDVKNLTEDQAREIYRKRYWNKINGDALAAKNPALATIAFDAAVNQGTGPANKMVAAAGGDPTKLIEMRKQRYDALVQAKPEAYGQFSKGWDKRLASLATAAIPIGSAQAAPEKTGIASVAPADDAASRIPGQSVQAPAAVAKEISFMGRQADKLGLSEDTQRNISNLSTAAGGAMGAGYIPSYVPKVPGGLATLGERAYEIMNPSKQMTAAQIEAMRMANQGSRVKEAAQAAEMAGALPGEALTAAQAVEAANAAKLAALPSKAEQVQNAAALRQAQEANQIATAAKVTQQAGQAAAGSAAIDEALKPTPAPAPAGGIPALVEGSKEDFRRSELEAQSKAESPIQAPAPVADAAAAAGEKPSWLTNDRALMMGLQLLAGSGKPGSGSAIRDLLSGLGTAGLGTLAQEKEERKAKASEAGELARSKAYEGQGRKYAAEADILESGNKAAVQAATIAKDRMKDFANTMQGKLADQPTRDRLYNQYLLDAYNQLGITPPTAMASAGTAGTGLKLLGVRPS